MKAIRKFDEFTREGVVKIQSSNKPRAEFLLNEAEQSYSTLNELLKSLELNDKNANIFIKSCYDIIMEIIRAKMLLKGYNAFGQGAHEAEVSYFREIGFKEKDVQFLEQMRYFRNGMLYYGTILDKIYARKVIDFTKNIYHALKKI